MATAPCGELVAAPTARAPSVVLLLFAVGLVRGDDWQDGFSTYHDGWKGGKCYGDGINFNGTDGSYWEGHTYMSEKLAAVTPAVFCGQHSSGCGTSHGWACGQCFELKCTGVQPPKVATAAEVCTDNTAIVWATDQCTGAPHCTKEFHFDVHRDIFKILAVNGVNENPITISWRPTVCPTPSGTKTTLRLEGHRDWFRLTPINVAGRGSLSKVEIKMDNPGTAEDRSTPPANTWVDMDPWEGAYFLIGSETSGLFDRIGFGPYHLRLTCHNGRQITFDLPSTLTDMAAGNYDVDDNCDRGGTTVTSSISAATITTTTATTTVATTTTAATTTTSTTSTSTSTTTTTVTGQSSCDANCLDIKSTTECVNANAAWSMCAGGGTWWHSQCQQTCQACESGLLPCPGSTSLISTTSGPTSTTSQQPCDATCSDIKPTADCVNANTAWSMCDGSSVWWQDQCRATCGRCCPSRRLAAAPMPSSRPSPASAVTQPGFKIIV